ncbi:NADH dehydrogenase [Thermus parvatiensis]|uniref:NADH dehydrogenase n=1 Tax=Thermus parvatiensis TaxID=456163 RepID=A0A0X8D9Q0_9DEIN|nr:nitroreductase family protein [Thermus parvatiensis]AMA75993.1 NADH dehydrogenase [Thermus parvatiensis]
MEATLPVLDAKTAALKRRSIRRYRKDPVPEGLLREILEAALRAPSAWNLQPWRVVVVRDPALKKALREAAFGQAQVEEAPVVLVLYADLEDALAHLDEVIHPGVQGEKREAQKAAIQRAFAAMTPEERARWAAGQSYILLGYLLLLLEAHGLGSVPMLGFDPERVKELLGFPKHVAIPALLPLGYPAEEGYPSHRLPMDRVVSWR